LLLALAGKGRDSLARENLFDEMREEHCLIPRAGAYFEYALVSR